MTSDTINFGEWYHIAGTSYTDGLNREYIRLYINGESVSNYTETAYYESVSSSQNVRIGQSAQGGTPFHGDVDEVRIYFESSLG